MKMILTVLVTAFLAAVFIVFLLWVVLRFTKSHPVEVQDIFRDVYAELSILERWYKEHHATKEEKAEIKKIYDALVKLETGEQI